MDDNFIDCVLVQLLWMSEHESKAKRCSNFKVAAFGGSDIATDRVGRYSFSIMQSIIPTPNLIRRSHPRPAPFCCDWVDLFFGLKRERNCSQVQISSKLR